MEENKKKGKAGDIIFIVLCLLIVLLFVGQKWLGWTW